MAEVSTPSVTSLDGIQATADPVTPVSRKRSLNAFASGSPGSLLNAQSEPKTRLLHTELFDRLATFKESTWSFDEGPLSPPRCARYGWSHRDVDTLWCATCNAEIVIDINAEEDVEAYGQQLQTSHAVGCPSRKHYLDESTYRFPLSSPTEHRLSFTSRFGDLIQHPNIIPRTCLDTSLGPPADADLEVDPVAIANATGLMDLYPDMDQKHIEACVLLALFGWEREILADMPCLKCWLCATVCPISELDLLTPTEGELENEDGRRKRRRVDQDDQPSTEQQSEEDTVVPSQFYVLQEHRTYCPWIAIPKRTSQKRVGWRTALAHVLAGKSARKTNPPSPINSASNVHDASDDAPATPGTADAPTQESTSEPLTTMQESGDT
ncbi:C3HC zinc finger-like-domain-containing protein [Gaertneriomyces semiglobifer]|nr:C3HC zinc finger-like-domain-containing protein [Gaertneriomyces semiglobifer]